MSKPRTRRGKPVDPLDTLPIFKGGLTPAGVVAALVFRCGLCNELGVDEAGELCADCAAGVLTRRVSRTTKTTTPRTTKPRARRAVT